MTPAVALVIVLLASGEAQILTSLTSSGAASIFICTVCVSGAKPLTLTEASST